MSETRFIQGTVIKIGETQGGLPKLALKVKDGSFRIAVLQIGSTLPALQAEFKQGNFTLGSELDGCKTYYEQPLKMKGDTHQDLNPCEAPITKIIPKEDIPEFKTDSDLVAIKMVSLAWDMTNGKDELTYDESMSFIKSAMGELMK